MASLYVIRGRDQGKHFLLRGDGVTIGREAGNDVHLNDTEVSRSHARVERLEDGAFQIVDLDSSNGTFVNSGQVNRHLLRSGDRVQVGRTLMIFTGGREPNSLAGQHGVDIVRQSENSELSQIRKSVPGEHSSLTSDVISSVAASQVELPGGLNVESSSPPSRDRNYWEIMYETSLAVSRTADIDQLLEQILGLIFSRVQCDRGCIMLMDEETRQLRPASRKNRRQQLKNNRMEISKTILDYVISSNQGVLTSNAADDARWDTAASIVQMGIQEAVCVPMQGRYGVVGAIYIDTHITPGEFVERQQASIFGEDDLRLMVAIGHQAALAIEDTSFYRGMLQAERLAAMGQTIATLSHHVKNILQGIRGGSYLIEEGLKGSQQDIIRKGWRIVDKNQERISNLVMDMLTYSKERQPELAPNSLVETIQDILELMQTRAAEASVNLAWQSPEKFPEVWFDAEALHRAILNIITNAIDACEGVDGAQVELSINTEEGNNQVSVTISDNGVGIPEEDLQKIFSVFESRKGSRGTGLGLPVSQKILKEHGGEVTVSSQVGVGTTFKLIWPGLRESPTATLVDRPTLLDDFRNPG